MGNGSHKPRQGPLLQGERDGECSACPNAALPGRASTPCRPTKRNVHALWWAAVDATTLWLVRALPHIARFPVACLRFPVRASAPQVQCPYVSQDGCGFLFTTDAYCYGCSGVSTQTTQVVTLCKMNPGVEEPSCKVISPDTGGLSHHNANVYLGYDINQVYYQTDYSARVLVNMYGPS